MANALAEPPYRSLAVPRNNWPAVGFAQSSYWALIGRLRTPAKFLGVLSSRGCLDVCLTMPAASLGRLHATPDLRTYLTPVGPRAAIHIAKHDVVAAGRG